MKEWNLNFALGIEYLRKYDELHRERSVEDYSCVERSYG